MPNVSQKTNRVSSAIDAVIATELPEHEDELRKFFERICEKYDESIRATTQYFLLVQLAWFVTFAIGRGWIKEIKLLDLELNPKMLVISPFLIGILTYLLLSSMAAAVILWEAVSRTVHHTLPSAWERGLDCLLAPPTFSSIERLLEPNRPSKLSYAWFALITLLVFLGPILALVTSIWVVSVLSETSRVLVSISAFLGSIAWLRGVSLSRTAIQATGGLALRHHRGATANRSKHWLHIH